MGEDEERAMTNGDAARRMWERYENDKTDRGYEWRDAMDFHAYLVDDCARWCQGYGGPSEEPTLVSGRYRNYWFG